MIAVFRAVFELFGSIREVSTTTIIHSIPPPFDVMTKKETTRIHAEVSGCLINGLRGLLTRRALAQHT